LCTDLGFGLRGALRIEACLGNTHLRARSGCGHEARIRQVDRRGAILDARDRAFDRAASARLEAHAVADRQTIGRAVVDHRRAALRRHDAQVDRLEGAVVLRARARREEHRDHQQYQRTDHLYLLDRLRIRTSWSTPWHSAHSRPSGR
jgi:hypothetical protein